MAEPLPLMMSPLTFNCLSSWMAAASVAEPSTLVIITTGEPSPRFVFHSRIERDDVPDVVHQPSEFPAPYVRYELDARQWTALRDQWRVTLGNDHQNAAVVAGAFALRSMVAAIVKAGVPCRRFVVTGEPWDVGVHDAWQTFADALAERISLRAVQDGERRGHHILQALHDPSGMARYPSMSAAIKAMAEVEPILIRPRLDRRRFWDGLFA